MRAPSEIAEAIEVALSLREAHPGVSFDGEELATISNALRGHRAPDASLETEARRATERFERNFKRLVVAARVVVFDDQSAVALKELDEASEVFADRVPWTDDPSRLGEG